MTVISPAYDKIIGATSNTDRNQALHNLKDLPVQKTQGLPILLKLQIDVNYMLTLNIDVGDRIFNGATAIRLEFIEIIHGETNTLYFNFEDPLVGKRARENRQRIMEMIPDLQSNWTPIKKIKLTLQKCAKNQET